MLPTQRGHNFGTYFITANCASKRTLFQVDRNATLLFDVLQHYREHYKLHAFVLMPDHFHLLLTPGDITLERCLRLIKGGFSRRYHQSGGLKDVWQTGYADHRCRDREDFLKHKRYIEQNPGSRRPLYFPGRIPVVLSQPPAKGKEIPQRLKPL